MEIKDAKAITEAFLAFTEVTPFRVMPIKGEKFERVLELTEVPRDSQKMQFPVEDSVREKGSDENLNTQYNDTFAVADFKLCRVLANYETDYTPNKWIRGVRSRRERQFQESQLEIKNNFVEVIGRFARQDPHITELMKRSLASDHRYSAMGILNLVFRSEEHDHDLWGHIPIVIIPGVIDPKKADCKEVAAKILEFGKAYQKPSLDYLREEGYNYEGYPLD